LLQQAQLFGRTFMGSLQLKDSFKVIFSCRKITGGPQKSSPALQLLASAHIKQTYNTGTTCM